MKKILMLIMSCCLSGIVMAQSVDDLINAVVDDDVRSMTKAVAIHGVNQQDKTGNSLLAIAAFEGSQRCFDELMKMNPDVNIKNSAGDTPIMVAALKGEKKMVDALIKAGGELNPEGWTPLIYAATNGHADIAKLLLDGGANIDATAPNGITALMMAAKGGQQETVKLLIWKGANLNKKTETGMTARKYAMATKNTVIADMLTKAGATE